MHKWKHNTKITKERIIEMDSWPPDYDVIYGRTDKECSYDEMSRNITELNDLGIASQNIDISDNIAKTIQTEKNIRKKEKYDLNSQDVVSEKDVIITFSLDKDDELTKAAETTNKNEVDKAMIGKSSSNFRNKTTGNDKLHKTFVANSQKLTHEPLSHTTLIEDPQIKTFGDALKYFKLYSQLRLFEISLEEVRQNKKSKEAHESDLKQFDKEIQKLSFKYHPDKVKHRGGTEEDIAVAQKLQTALNATRTVLNVLNTTFLEDINMEHHYGYYTKLNISSLGNEDEVKNHVCEVMFKVSFISEIKQQNIIAEIRQFLIESKSCIEAFFNNNISGFEKCRNSALFHFKKCIKGYKKLLAEFREVEKECTNENLDNINSLLKRMSSDCSRNLKILKEIKKIAKKSLSDTCHFYSTSEYLDDYFVLPFATYVNIIVMCNVMLKNGNQTFWGDLYSNYSEPAYNHSTSAFLCLYYLASYFNGNKQYKSIVETTLGPNHLCNEEIKKEFCLQLQQLNPYLEDKFRINNYYVENRHGNYLVEEYKKCMTMMADFKMKEKELRKGIKKLECRNQELENKYDEAMKASKELNNKFEERLAQIKLLKEKTSASLACSQHLLHALKCQIK